MKGKTSRKNYARSAASGARGSSKYSYTRRRNAFRKIPRGIPMNALRVCRTWYAGQVVPSTASTAGFWSYVTPSLSTAGTIAGTALASLPNSAEYTNLFDTFKINAVKFKFRPRNVDLNLSQTNPSTGTVYTDVPYVTYLADSYNTLTPSGIYGITAYNTLLQEGKVKTIRGDKEFSIYMKPKIQEQFGSGAVRFVKPKYTATDTNGTTMPHRGFHIFFHSYNFTGVFNQYDVYVTYYMTFRGQK